jgi:group I intron endonuclease
MNLLKPEYNILKFAGSSTGKKHSLETIAKFKNRKHSLETIAKIKAKREGYKHSPETIAKFKNRKHSPETIAKMKEKMQGRPRPELSGSPSISVEMFDTQNNVTTVYPSISEAALGIGVDKGYMSRAFKQKGDII